MRRMLKFWNNYGSLCRHPAGVLATVHWFQRRPHQHCPPPMHPRLLIKRKVTRLKRRATQGKVSSITSCIPFRQEKKALQNIHFAGKRNAWRESCSTHSRMNLSSCWLIGSRCEALSSRGLNCGVFLNLGYSLSTEVLRPR